MRKKQELVKMMQKRHSTRVFSEKEVKIGEVLSILNTLQSIPSSCDRHGIYPRLVEDKAERSFLGGLLVGGVGWIHRAPVVVLLFADHKAYKENLLYMPYLDAGVALYHILLMAEDKGFKACYVNPQVKERQVKYFADYFGDDIFCGAIAMGYEEE